MAKDNDQHFPVTPAGSVYPKDYLVAVFDDLQDAEKAVQALRDAGFGAEDIRLLRGQELIERFQNVENVEKKQNLLSRLASAFRGAEEGADTAAYLEEARRGHSILNVYAGKAERAEQISNILTRYHAHLIKYYGNWTITNLPTPDV